LRIPLCDGDGDDDGSGSPLGRLSYEAVRAVVHAHTARCVRPDGAPLLSSAARLVELTAVVSLPGAFAQDPHAVGIGSRQLLCKSVAFPSHRGSVTTPNLGYLKSCAHSRRASCEALQFPATRTYCRKMKTRTGMRRRRRRRRVIAVVDGVSDRHYQPCSRRG
jgi:hypothetical protein